MAIQLKNKAYTPATPSVSLTAFTATGNMVMNGITVHEATAGGTVRMYLYNASDASVTEIINVTTTTAGQQILSAPLGMQVNDEIRVNVNRTGPTLVFSYALSTADLTGVALDALSDTNVPSPTTNDVLTWNGTSWVSSAPTGGGGAVDSVNGQTGVVVLDMDDINNVIAPTPATGDVLSYSGGSWVLNGGLQDILEVVKSGATTNSLYNTINDTTKGYINLNTDGVVIGKNNSSIDMSENSPTIMDFNVQDDGVTPAQITAMRITNEVGQSNAPQIVLGGSTPQGSYTATVNGDGYVANNFVVNNDLTIGGNLIYTLTTQNLDDFNVSSPLANQVLKWDGTDWANAYEANAFQRVAVSGQSTVIANDYKSTLTLAEGNGITITTNATTDTVTISKDTDYSYLHDQPTGATTWSVAHNLDNDRPIVQCYDATGEMIVPQTITITDANNLSIVFASSQTGKAVVSGGNYATAPRLHRTAVTGTTSLTASHNLVGVTLSAPATITLPNPSTLKSGHQFIIKDEGGNMQTYNLTIDTVSGTIDGDTSKTVAVNYTSVTIYTDGSNYFII